MERVPKVCALRGMKKKKNKAAVSEQTDYVNVDGELRYALEDNFNIRSAHLEIISPLRRRTIRLLSSVI